MSNIAEWVDSEYTIYTKDKDETKLCEIRR